MANRVTVQDIADALGISRNTVSKAINNSPGLSAATRDKVLQKAAEMGYKQFSYLTMVSQELSQSQAVKETEEKTVTASDVEADPAPVREIALLMEGFQDSSHFAHPMLDKFQRQLAQLGYVMTIHNLTGAEVEQCRLPLSFRSERTSGILCIELFSEPYARMLCELGIPLLFVDTPVLHDGGHLPADVLLMDNTQGIAAFVREMIRQGKKEIGFVGRIDHCYSFFERYMAFRNAMFLNGVPIREEYCLTDNVQNKRYPDHEVYLAYLRKSLSKLERLPDVFICANDFVALDLMLIFKEMGWSVPKDVLLCGFDDSPKAKLVQPPLTSIRIHSEIMGFSAIQLLLSRINEPELSFRTIYTETNLIYRESAPKK